MLMFIRGSLTETHWTAALLLQPLKYSEGSSAVIKFQRDNDWGPALPPSVLFPVSGSRTVTSSFHDWWLKAWLPHVRSAAQVVGAWPSAFWPGDSHVLVIRLKKGYSVLNKETISLCRKKWHILAWAVVPVLQLQRDKEQFKKEN